MKKILIAVLLLTAIPLLAKVNAKLLRYPDVSKDSITFVYGGNIWVVSKSGGTAKKLTSPKGEEMFPKFSPDGKSIAFTGNYDGNFDIYLIPSSGGLVKRLTYHGGSDLLLGWYPDGKSVLFSSGRYSERQRYSQFFKVNIKGGLPQKLSVPYGQFASLSNDGQNIAYTKKSRLFRTWKRYRGGTAADISLFNLKTLDCENITNNSANDELPMWHNDKIYYLSDRGQNKRANIWVYDLNSKEHTQITKFKDFDVHFPSIGPDDIVFEAQGKLYLLNLKNNNYNEVKIDVVTDLARVKPKHKDVSKYFNYTREISPSPQGKRVVVQARGEIFTLPVKEGFVENISQSSGSAERFPAWSPDGEKIAYWSDKSGEYQLTIYNNKTKKSRTLTSFKNGFKYNLYWSPDSKKLAYIDQSMTISIFNLKDKTVQKVDQALWKMHGALQYFSCNWSSDSNWLTYSRGLENRKHAIFLYNVKSKKRYMVTSGYYNDSDPVFDPEGKYLYFTSDRNFQPLYSDLDSTWIYANATKLMALTLRKDVNSPINAKNDHEEIKKSGKKKDKSKNSKKDKKEEKVKSLIIDTHNMEERAVELADGGNIGNLSAVKGKVLFMQWPPKGSKSRVSSLKYYDLEKREEKEIVKGISSYTLCANSKNILAGSKGRYYIIAVSPRQKLKDSIKIKKLFMELSPVKEWAQILKDAWRLQRDYFYDPNMHGVDWQGVYNRYSKLLPYVVCREDLNFLIGEMIGELNASHAYKGGGDIEYGKRVNMGYLGIDWEKSGNFYKIKDIIKAAKWDSEVISPLNYPGLKVKKGDYILAVNGVKIKSDLSPYAYFQGLGRETIRLTINDKPTFANAKNIVVKTLSSERRLRHLAWIEKNRKRVDKATKGRIGYIYVRSTGIDGQNELVRQFYAQFNKEGLIIDERFNDGGQIPDRFIELLNRKPLAFWALRDGHTWQHPVSANFGPKVMLINGWSGSGGDAFPTYFKMSKLGPLIGTRTWGGLIGISGAPGFIDGGRMTVPTFRMYTPDGVWFKEGHGVDPDIEVIDDATQLAKGIDPQIEAGIKEVLKLLKKNPPVKPVNPPYEKR